MAAVLPHLEQIGVLASRLGQESRAQGMAGEQFGRITGCGRGSLHHQRHALGAHRLLGEAALRCELAKHRPCGDPGLLDPGVIMAYRLQPGSVEHGDALASAKLVRL